jgi:hypothetical protein
MNIAASGRVASTSVSAGPSTTQAMMNDAVTGTARPSTLTATAANTAVSIRITVGFEASAWAASTSPEASVWPRPVLVIVEVITPAAAHTAITGSAPRMPSASASAIERSQPSSAALVPSVARTSLATSANRAATPLA